MIHPGNVFPQRCFMWPASTRLTSAPRCYTRHSHPHHTRLPLPGCCAMHCTHSPAARPFLRQHWPQCSSINSCRHCHCDGQKARHCLNQRTYPSSTVQLQFRPAIGLKNSQAGPALGTKSRDAPWSCSTWALGEKYCTNWNILLSVNGCLS